LFTNLEESKKDDSLSFQQSEFGELELTRVVVKYYNYFNSYSDNKHPYDINVIDMYKLYDKYKNSSVKQH
jgi:hypothetical protein